MQQQVLLSIQARVGLGKGKWEGGGAQELKKEKGISEGGVGEGTGTDKAQRKVLLQLSTFNKPLQNLASRERGKVKMKTRKRYDFSIAPPKKTMQFLNSGIFKIL